jgi:hypothetical protein
MSSYLFLAATVAMLSSILLWYAFVRAAPQKTISGVITTRTFLPARTIQRYQAGARSEVWSRDDIAVPESYLFEIRVEGISTPLQYSVLQSAGQNYQVGQRVTIRYAEQGLPLLQKKIRVMDMAPAATGSEP